MIDEADQDSELGTDFMGASYGQINMSMVTQYRFVKLLYFPLLKKNVKKTLLATGRLAVNAAASS